MAEVTIKHPLTHEATPDQIEEAAREEGIKGEFTVKRLFSESGNESRYEVQETDKPEKVDEAEAPVDTPGPVVGAPAVS
jgi:hypothetical protein